MENAADSRCMLAPYGLMIVAFIVFRYLKQLAAIGRQLLALSIVVWVFVSYPLPNLNLTFLPFRPNAYTILTH